MKTSVALCTYNGEKYLGQQIDSILNQTHPVDEIVVCDDGSTDSTISIIQKYQKDYPNIFKIFRNEVNLRSVKNFEKAISLCQNDIIFLSDQDDVWVEHKVEHIVNYFINNPRIEVVATNGYGIDENNNLLSVYSLWDVPIFLEEKNIDVDYFEITSYIGNISTGASMAIKKNFVSQIVPFPIVQEFHHDHWIAMVATYQNKFSFLQSKLFKYRVHSQQQVGNVFLKKTEKNKKILFNHFYLALESASFSSYKKILKRLSQSYNRNLEFKIPKDSLMHEIMLIKLEGKYFKIKNEMEKKYPLKSFLIGITDNILKKRKLNKS